MLGKETLGHNSEVTSKYFAHRKIRDLRDVYLKNK
jgi:hypothetical protein